jgi:hypothetical protein
VSKSPKGDERKPAAEVLRRVVCPEGSPNAISLSLLSDDLSKISRPDTSQLNRLGLAYFHPWLLPISARLLRLFVGAKLKASLSAYAQVLAKS